MKKGMKVFLTAAIMSFAFSAVTYAGTWQPDGTNWRYQKDDASYAVAEWITDDGAWYYVDQDGLMKTGWLQLNGNWYYFDTDGKMRTTSLIINEAAYYFDANGVCTNPEGSAYNSTAQTLTEEQYIVRLLDFSSSLLSVTKQVDEQMSQLDENDFATAIKAMNDLKAPFQSFLTVSAPAKYSGVHEHFKNGCSSMISALDVFIIALNNPNMSESDLDVYEAQFRNYMYNAMTEFNAGEALLYTIK